MTGATRMKSYVVRNRKGQYIGTYRAINPQAAIAACVRAQAVHNSTFRGPSLTAKDLTATVGSTQFGPFLGHS